MIVQQHLVFGRKNKIPIPTDYILAYDFNGNSIDKSANNNNGINTNVSFSNGRKLGTQCAIFSGNSFVETTNNITYNSNKASISLWIESQQISQAFLLEQGSTYEQNRAFCLLLNWYGVNQFQFTSYDGNYNLVENRQGFTNWTHFLVTLDRDLVGAQEIKVYRNGVLSHNSSTAQGNHVNVFTASKLILGYRKSNNTAYYNGKIQDFRLYNRVLTQEEILTLYNE